MQEREEEEEQKIFPLDPILIRILSLSLLYSCCDRRDQLVDCLKLEKNRPNIIAGLSPLPAVLELVDAIISFYAKTRRED